jgi:hypothetical protein
MKRWCGNFLVTFRMVMVLPLSGTASISCPEEGDYKFLEDIGTVFPDTTMLLEVQVEVTL